MLNIVSRLLCAVPLGVALAMGRGMAAIWYYLVPVRLGVARANIERVFGATASPARQKRILRRSMVNLCYYVVESLRAPALTRETSQALVQHEQLCRIDTLLARGRGVIAVTAHLGNFDLLGTSQAIRGYPVHAIVKDITWRSGQRFISRVRAKTGLGRVAPRRSKAHIAALLRQNQIVAFLIDQHLPPHRSIVARFFGQWAATTPAPVRFALQTGAPIAPIFIVRTDKPGYHRIIVHPEFHLQLPFADEARNVRHNTERLNRLLEEMIVAFPEQWLWHHRRWKVRDVPAGCDMAAHADGAAR